MIAGGRTPAPTPLQETTSSVRAGTERPQPTEGARGDSAARCTNCHVVTQSWGQSIAARTNSHSLERGGASAASHPERRKSAESAGAGIMTERWSGRYSPSSTVAQPSFAHPPLAAQHPVSSACSLCAAKSPAASKPQCCVANSQTAITTTANSLLRNRLTATSERGRGQVSTPADNTAGITKLCQRGASDCVVTAASDCVVAGVPACRFADGFCRRMRIPIPAGRDARHHSIRLLPCRVAQRILRQIVLRHGREVIAARARQLVLGQQVLENGAHAGLAPLP
jgi:hypothetical protein